MSLYIMYCYYITRNETNQLIIKNIPEILILFRTKTVLKLNPLMHQPQYNRVSIYTNKFEIIKTLNLKLVI